MKAKDIAILIMSVIIVGLVWYFTPDAKPTKPATLNMELYSVTPHGHQVFKKCENGTCVFVLVLHENGYPIAITSTCK